MLVNLTIFRDDFSVVTDYASKLSDYGFYEWLEIRDVIQKSKSKYKEYVDYHLNKLFERISQIVDIPPLPHKSVRRRKSIPASEEEPSHKNETEIQFSKEVVLGPPPDLSALNLSLPGYGSFSPDEVLSDPYGIVFVDHEGIYRYQRVYELYLCPLNHLLNLIYWCDLTKFGAVIKALIFKHLKDLKRQGEPVPDVFISEDDPS